jgi:hypothetical protein
MKMIVPLCVFGLVAGLFFAVASEGRGAIKPAVCQSVDGTEAICKLISGDGSWSLAPAKYTYWCNGGEARVNTTISNLADESVMFDLGDGNTTTVPASGNLTYSYSVNLDGSTTRFYIAKEGQGWIRDVLTLKIEPKWKGKDTR